MGFISNLIGRREDLEFTTPYDPTEEDCFSCRALGATAMTSLGAYTYYSGMNQLRERRKIIENSKSYYKYGARQLGIVSLSATFVGLGIYRMFN